MSDSREKWKETPLLERLRSFEYLALDHICCEAADEIERLTEDRLCRCADEVRCELKAEIERLREQVVNLQTRNNALYEAIDILKRGGKLK